MIQNHLTYPIPDWARKNNTLELDRTIVPLVIVEDAAKAMSVGVCKAFWNKEARVCPATSAIAHSDWRLIVTDIPGYYGDGG